MPAFARTGTAHLPLHGGKAPAWLFERMTKLAREVCIVVVEEFGPEEILRRLSDPYWFQAFGCALGFDWHSSGLTTTTCGALKEGLRGIESDLGLFVAGGKGGTSRQTPAQIEAFGDRFSADPAQLIYASKMAAKVDSAAVQDGYQLYHHVFIFTRNGSWAVVQQGMNESTRYARRYHWLGETVADFVCEPHAAICAEMTGSCLNLVAEESSPARKTITAIAAQEKPEKTLAELGRIRSLELPVRHYLRAEDIHPERLGRILISTYERSPQGFEELLSLPGVGPKTIRALSLLSELVYGAPASFSDPARFSFAHGGKDGIPYPVDCATYDQSIALLRKAISRSRMGLDEKRRALARLDGRHTSR